MVGMGGFEIKKRKPFIVIYDSEIHLGDGSPLGAAILPTEEVCRNRIRKGSESI